MLASGITAIAGFGVLVLSSITMLRDFGFVTLIDLSVSLAGVLLVLPAVLALSERDDLLEAARGSVAPGDRGAAAAGPARPGRVSEPTSPPARSPQHRLDPDRRRRVGGHRPPPRPSRRAPGRRRDRHPALPVDDRHLRPGARGRVLGLQFASHGVGSTGVPAGQRLHFFAAPLAASTLNGAANLNPPCTLARHDPARAQRLPAGQRGRSCSRSS